MTQTHTHDGGATGRDGLTSPVTEPATRPRPRGMTIFRAAEAEEIFANGAMSFPVFDEGDMAAVSEEGLDISASGIGNVSEVLFRGEGDIGFSLVKAWFAPHYVLPRHTHNADCLYYIVEGSIVMGSQHLSAGDGFFIPENAPYAYEAGPDGVVVLEFRDKASFDMQVPGGQVARFRKMAEVGTAHAADWSEQRKAAGY
jgi:quercetin dioxygenase-like cupin family protein